MSSGMVRTVAYSAARVTGSYQHKTLLNRPRSTARMVFVSTACLLEKGLRVHGTPRHAWIL